MKITIDNKEVVAKNIGIIFTKNDSLNQELSLTMGEGSLVAYVTVEGSTRAIDQEPYPVHFSIDRFADLIKSFMINESIARNRKTIELNNKCACSKSRATKYNANLLGCDFEFSSQPIPAGRNLYLGSVCEKCRKIKVIPATFATNQVNEDLKRAAVQYLVENAGYSLGGATSRVQIMWEKVH